MAERTIPNSGDPRVDAALDRIRGKFTDLEDAMIVQAHLTKGLVEQLKDHAEFIAGHRQAIREMDDKLNALVDILGRRQGGMESRPN